MNSSLNIRKKILFIAPLPPPMHGQSYVSNVLLVDLQREHEVQVINFTKKRNAGKLYFLLRYFEVFRILGLIWKNRKNKDAIYITISQSLLGNIKDIITYVFLSFSLQKITIHLHGGSIKKELWNKIPMLESINKYFIKKINGAIISGESHKYIFSELIDEKKIYKIPNFAMDEIFLSEERVTAKFNESLPLKILYVSGMRAKKGYLDLLKGYQALPVSVQEKVMIDFAGEFETNIEKEEFIREIQGYGNICYHGVITDKEKIELFSNNQIFCLPTKYLEGQPISIIEAYASGCCVLTTNLGGISDIFSNKFNGIKINPGDSASIAEKIGYCLENHGEIRKIAMSNFEMAKKLYKKDVFVKSVSDVILKNA